jgi:hypothetical protein
VSLEEIRARTEADYTISPLLRAMQCPA